MTAALAFVASACTAEGPGELERSSHASAQDLPGELAAENSFGIATSYSSLGPIDTSNAFFRTDLGTNGRSCVPCHDPRAGWEISGDLANQLFKESDGLDPLFRIHDTGTRPDAPVATESDRRKAYAPTIETGASRFPTTVSPSAEFEVVAVDDPYGWSTPELFARFRVPTTTAQETQVASLTSAAGLPPTQGMLENLMQGATSFHGQGVDPVPSELKTEGALFMLSVSHAQAYDNKAGRLDSDGARGGPVHLSQQEWYPGINSGAEFNPKVFDIFDAWLDSDDSARARIARGQEVFNFKTFGARGSSCSSCHNSPNVGSSSGSRMFDIGTADPEPQLKNKLPFVTIRNKATGEVRVVTDLGLAAGTGLWDDVGRFRAGQLRGLAARAPFFHDGRARDIHDLVKHYEVRFGIEFHGTERADLEAFLYAL